MTVTHEQLQARITELEQYRERLIAEANAELQRIAGGLAELERLVEDQVAQESTSPSY